MSDLFGGSTQPKYLGPEERTAYAVSEANTLTQGFREAFNSAQGAKQKQDAVDNERNFQAEQDKKAMDKMAPIAKALGETKSFNDINALINKNPAWLLDKDTAPYVARAMKTWMDAEKIQGGSMAAHVTASGVKQQQKDIGSLSARHPDLATPFAQGNTRPFTDEEQKKFGEAQLEANKRDRARALEAGSVTKAELTPGKPLKETFGTAPGALPLTKLQGERDKAAAAGDDQKVGEINASIFKLNRVNAETRAGKLEQDLQEGIDVGARPEYIQTLKDEIAAEKVKSTVDPHPHTAVIAGKNYLIQGNRATDIDKLPDAQKSELRILEAKIKGLNASLLKAPEDKETQIEPDSRTQQVLDLRKQLHKFLPKPAAAAPAAAAPAVSAPAAPADNSFKTGRFTITPE